MSKELKICKSFIKASLLCSHKRRKTRIKNLKRRDRIFKKMMKRYGKVPMPKEWQ